uniref:Uncharacterized protein n=1 Tax=Chelonoidis abingdonii TaxID=106734 RepID=A0A8C0JCX1_CHEAB
MKGSGKALIRHSRRAALPSISITSFSACSTRGGPFSFSSLRDLAGGRTRSRIPSCHVSHQETG